MAKTSDASAPQSNATPIARMKVEDIKEGTYANRWRKVLILKPADENDKLIAEEVVVSADLFPQARKGDVLELSLAAMA